MSGLAGAKLERYLYYDCVLLALAVSDQTGWPVVQLFEASGEPLSSMNDKRDPREWLIRHAMVRMPDGRLLDAAGPHDNYSGEEPFNLADWEMDERDAGRLWRDPEVMADAGELAAPGLSAGAGRVVMTRWWDSTRRPRWWDWARLVTRHYPGAGRNSCLQLGDKGRERAASFGAKR
jgi:hypothetical protein